jgi:hypothetical protein
MENFELAAASPEYRRKVIDGLPPIQWKCRSEANIAGQRARDAGQHIDVRDDRYLPGTPEREQFQHGWMDRDQVIRNATTADDLYAPLIPPAAHTLADPVPNTIPTGLPPYDYEVKSWPQFFEPMVAGKKLHDMRNKKDRSYKVGDRMLLREFDPFGGGYTGRVAIAHITYITSNDTPCALSSVGLGDDMAILSVRISGPYPDDDRHA